MDEVPAKSQKLNDSSGDHFDRPNKGELLKWFERYDMTHKNRGIVYIFNVENFSDSKFKTCHGTSKDTRDFKSALMNLGFREEDIHVFTDLRTGEMEEVLQRFDEENPDIDIDCFICAILSCGDSDDLIYGYDGAIKLEKLLSYLRPDRCPCLKGIPKLFFVQACRGSKIDSGIEKDDADSDGFEKTSPKIPIMADMLVVNSSCNEYPSFGNKEEGSWFMQALSKFLRNYGYEYEIMTLLTTVSNYVASLGFQSSNNSEYNGCKQMPHIVSTLTKQLKFLNRDH